jgi:acyl-CoA thioester hydrolase
MTPTRAHFSVLTPKRVRYHECDMQKVVFNGHYLAYADIASTEYFRALAAKDGLEAVGYELFAPDGDIMARHSELDFRGSAHADDLLHLGARVKAFGRTSFVMEFAVFRNDELLTVITTRYVYVTKADMRPANVPQDFRDRVGRLETVRPD